MEKLNILLLRGLSREARHWGDFPELLKKSKCIDKVLCLDLPGAGLRNNELFPIEIKDYVLDLKEKMKDEFPKGDWGILAISMGGMIALEWVSMFPKDFKKNIIINISASNLSKPWKRLSLGTVGFILKSLYVKSPEAKEKGIKVITTNINMDDSVTEAWVQLAIDNPVKTSNFFRQLKAAANFRVSSHFEIDTLILASENDHLADVSNSKNLYNKIDNAKLELHNLAGHDLPLDDPEWVIDKVEKFITQ